MATFKEELENLQALTARLQAAGVTLDTQVAARATQAGELVSPTDLAALTTEREALDAAITDIEKQVAAQASSSTDVSIRSSSGPSATSNTGTSS